MPFFKAKNHTLPRSRVLENLSKKNGLRHTIFNTVGDKYTGEWKNNEKSGQGIILTRNNELYEGDLDKNYRHGFGVLANRIPNTDVFKLSYRGDWKNGRMHGNGLRIYPDGSFYLGEFKNGKRHGHGQQWYPDGAFFDGEYINDVRAGLGVLIRADGNRYEGDWKNDMKHGKGVFFHLDNGQLQEGVWYEDWCTHSQIRDIRFRQCALAPTPYPIQIIRLKFPDKVCELATERALAGNWDPCFEEDYIHYEKLASLSQESYMALLGKTSQYNKVD